MTQVEKYALIGQAAVGGLCIGPQGPYSFCFIEEQAEAAYQNYLTTFSDYKTAWENANHNGSCVKNPGCCMACFYAEDFLSVALMISIGLSRTPQERYLAEEFWAWWNNAPCRDAPEEMPEYITQWVDWVINKVNSYV